MIVPGRPKGVKRGADERPDRQSSLAQNGPAKAFQSFRIDPPEVVAAA